MGIEVGPSSKEEDKYQEFFRSSTYAKNLFLGYSLKSSVQGNDDRRKMSLIRADIV